MGQPPEPLLNLSGNIRLIHPVKTLQRPALALRSWGKELLPEVRFDHTGVLQPYAKGFSRRDGARQNSAIRRKPMLAS